MESLGGGNVSFYKSSLRAVGPAAVCSSCLGSHSHESMSRQSWLSSLAFQSLALDIPSHAESSVFTAPHQAQSLNSSLEAAMTDLSSIEQDMEQVWQELFSIPELQVREL
jgi:hypothetical protein